MKIQLTAEEDRLVESLITLGRFSSASEVVSASLALMQSDLQWHSYAQSRIDAGVAASSLNDFASEEDVDSLFEKYLLKSA